ARQSRSALVVGQRAGVGAAAEARGVVVVARRVRRRPVLAALAVELRVEVVATAEARVVGPLVDVADHVVDAVVVRAGRRRRGGLDRVFLLVGPRIVERATRTLTLVEEDHRGGPV